MALFVGSRATPNALDYAYLRMIDPAHGPNGGAPTSSRICQDVSKVVSALIVVRDVREIAVQGLGNRNGHREAATAGKGGHGGKRVKKAGAKCGVGSP